MHLPCSYHCCLCFTLNVIWRGRVQWLLNKLFSMTWTRRTTLSFILQLKPSLAGTFSGWRRGHLWNILPQSFAACISVLWFQLIYKTVTFSLLWSLIIWSLSRVNKILSELKSTSWLTCIRSVIICPLNLFLYLNQCFCLCERERECSHCNHNVESKI